MLFKVARNLYKMAGNMSDSISTNAMQFKTFNQYLDMCLQAIDTSLNNLTIGSMDFQRLRDNAKLHNV